MMMQKIAIGLAAAIIATGGSTLSASAARGGGDQGGRGGHSGGMTYRGGGMGKLGAGPSKYRPGGGAQFAKGEPRPGGPYGQAGKHRPSNECWGRHCPRPGHWETRNWSRYGTYPRYTGGYGGGGSCWRWVETRFGPERKWVCGYGRGYGGYGSYGSYRYGGSYSKWVPGRGHGPIGHGPIGHGRMK
jgi:ATP-dependent RNA helicase RhlE